MVIPVAFHASRRHTNLADVPSGVSQIIIKLSFGNVKNKTFYRRLGFAVRGGLLSAGGLNQSRRGRERQMPVSQPRWVWGKSHLLAHFSLPLTGRQFLPSWLVLPLAHSMKLSMKEACYFRQFKISPLLTDSFTQPFTPA